MNNRIGNMQICAKPTNQNRLCMHLLPQTHIQSHTTCLKNRRKRKRNRPSALSSHDKVQSNGFAKPPLGRVTPNDGCVKKGVWKLDPVENGTSVGVFHGDVEFGERTDDLGDDVAALFEAIEEDLSVDLLDLSDASAAIEEVIELGFQEISSLFLGSRVKWN
uniref:Uncharacterized protein n=1 Tax=Rhizophora mucronata TaxID=61149 RepID=A0A2P2Q334_RHIMU